MTTLAILLAVAASAGSPQCSSGSDPGALNAVRETPKPMGMILGTGNDWGSKFLVVRTTHHLAVPGIPTRKGTESVTYYAAARDRVCSQEIKVSACPHLDLAIRAYRGRSYVVMFNRAGLRSGASYHPPYALLHVQDGDGNLIKINASESDHPLFHDAAQTFRSIEACTKAVDEAVGGL